MYAIGIGGLIYAIRFGEPSIQSFLLYNLPDGLWALGFTGLLLSLQKLPKPYAWIGLLVLLGFLGELLQGYRVIPGTFDYIDILCYLGGTILAILYHLFLHHKTTRL